MAVADVETALDENLKDVSRNWWQIAKRMQDILPLMPKHALWHDTVFSFARVCHIVYIPGALDFHIIPGLEKYISLTLRLLMANDF
jgi:hypothetical protein